MIGHRAVQSSITQALAANGRGVGVVTDLARYGARNAHSSLAAHAAHKVMREPASSLGSALQHANPETPGRAAQKLFAQDVLMGCEPVDDWFAAKRRHGTDSEALPLQRLPPPD